MIIKPFRGDYAFLSNMWEAEIVYDLISYPSSEHAYQAQKFKDQAIKLRVAALLTPGEAKRFPREHPELQTYSSRADWDQRKLYVMERVIKAKFQQHPKLAQMLKETMPHELVEEGWWHDNFYGTCTCGNRDGRHKRCLLPGKNHLGRILMLERKSLLKKGDLSEPKIRWDW